MVGCAVKLGDGPFEPLILLAIAGPVPKLSDWKNLAYPFVYRLFDKIKENNGGG